MPTFNPSDKVLVDYVDALGNHQVWSGVVDHWDDQRKAYQVKLMTGVAIYFPEEEIRAQS